MDVKLDQRRENLEQRLLEISAFTPKEKVAYRIQRLRTWTYHSLPYLAVGAAALGLVFFQGSLNQLNLELTNINDTTSYIINLRDIIEAHINYDIPVTFTGDVLEKPQMLLEKEMDGDYAYQVSEVLSNISNREVLLGGEELSSTDVDYLNSLVNQLGSIDTLARKPYGLGFAGSFILMIGGFIQMLKNGSTKYSPTNLDEKRSFNAFIKEKLPEIQRNYQRSPNEDLFYTLAEQWIEKNLTPSELKQSMVILGNVTSESYKPEFEKAIANIDMLQSSQALCRVFDNKGQ